MRINRNAPCPCGSGKKAKRCCHAPPPPKPEGWTLTVADEDDMDLEELRGWALGNLDPDGESWIFPPTDDQGRWFWFLEGRDARRFAADFYPGRPFVVIPIAEVARLPQLRQEPLIYSGPAKVGAQVFNRRARLCV